MTSFKKIFILVTFFLRTSFCAELFDFGIFENFVANGKIFEAEVQIIHRLREIRGLLKSVSRLKTLSPPSKQMLSSQRKLQFSDLGAINQNLMVNSTTQNPTKIMNGAMDAMVHLQSTYNLDTSEMARGIIKTNNKKFDIGHVPMQGRESLDCFELITFATVATKGFMFGSAAEFIREAENIYQRNKGVMSTMLNADGSKANFDEILQTFKRNIVSFHNKGLAKKKHYLTNDHWTLPYMLDEKTLMKKKKQPKFIKTLASKEYMDFFIEKNTTMKDFAHHQGMKMICGRKATGDMVLKEKPFHRCTYLHHSDPYLKLGPFKIEIFMSSPLRWIFHDILSEREMDFLIEYSTPRLSNARDIPESNKYASKADQSSGKKGRTVAKTNQVWMTETIWKQMHQFYNKENTNPPEWDYLDIQDPYGYFWRDSILWKLSKKIELATGYNITARHGSSMYQVTNYGLAGSCESHMDPVGMFDGIEIPEDRKAMAIRGDYIATFMAWLKDVPSGGGTVFNNIGQEDVIQPIKGAAAFWTDLSAGSNRDHRSKHAGCPTLSGSKWILNKWINSFDQWNLWPCNTKSPTQEMKQHPKTSYVKSYFQHNATQWQHENFKKKVLKRYRTFSYFM